MKRLIFSLYEVLIKVDYDSLAIKPRIRGSAIRMISIRFKVLQYPLFSAGQVVSIFKSRINTILLKATKYKIMLNVETYPLGARSNIPHAPWFSEFATIPRADSNVVIVAESRRCFAVITTELQWILISAVGI
jgi:hypothetical protein